MKKTIFLMLLITLTATSCTTGARNPSSAHEEKRMDKLIDRLDHQIHRSSSI